MWEERLRGLVNRTIVYFFPNDTATEVSCELPTNVQCNTDQHSFKNYLHRWMATTTQIAPIVYDQIMDVLRTSAAAAVQSCTDGVDNGNGVSTATCGFRWTTGAYDGSTGAGQQMNVLGALISMLVATQSNSSSAIGGPVTNSNGGNSTGDPNAGTEPDVLRPLQPVYTRDKVGAGILTTVLMGTLLAMVVWINTECFETISSSRNFNV